MCLKRLTRYFGILTKGLLGRSLPMRRTTCLKGISMYKVILIMLLAVMSSNAAQAEKKLEPAPLKVFGSWIAGELDNNEGVYAATINDSKGILGQYCYSDSGTCLWLIVNEVECTENNKYVVLVNSEVGAAQMELYCIKIGNTPRYDFQTSILWHKQLTGRRTLVLHSQWRTATLE